MKINIEDIKITSEMVCRFVEGTSMPEEDRIILSKMRIDREFARELRDLMDAMDALSEVEVAGVPAEEEYPYAAAAFASFAKQDTDPADCFFSASPKSADGLVDDFLDGYDNEEEEDEE